MKKMNEFVQYLYIYIFFLLHSADLCFMFLVYVLCFGLCFFFIFIVFLCMILVLIFVSSSFCRVCFFGSVFGSVFICFLVSFSLYRLSFLVWVSLVSGFGFSCLVVVLVSGST